MVRFWDRVKDGTVRGILGIGFVLDLEVVFGLGLGTLLMLELGTCLRFRFWTGLGTGLDSGFVTK